MFNFGGVGFRRRPGAAGLEGGLSLRHMSALHLWGGPALPHDSWLQHQAEAVATGRAPDKEMPALGTDLAEGVRLGPGGRLIGRNSGQAVQACIRIWWIGNKQPRHCDGASEYFVGR